MLPRLAILCLLLVLATGVGAAEPAESPDYFEKKIRPLLTEHCFKCHGDLKGKEPKGGLRLDSRAAMLKGGDNGTALVPGNPDKSKIIEAVRYSNADMQMPPKGKLADTQIAELVAWVKAGAVWPSEAGTAIANASSFDLAKRKQEHWAWQPVKPTAPPTVRDARWPTDPLDQFILAKLEEKGLKPAKPADPRADPPRDFRSDGIAADAGAESRSFSKTPRKKRGEDRRAAARFAPVRRALGRATGSISFAMQRHGATSSTRSSPTPTSTATT